MNECCPVKNCSHQENGSCNPIQSPCWHHKQLINAATKTDNLTFGLALEAVKKGKGMRLPQWSPDVVIRCQYPDEHSKMTAPYLYVESRFGRVPWKETMIELFAENWIIVD